jgi:hypothetical protein
MRDWTQVVWNRKPRILLRKQGKFVLDAFRGNLTPEVRSVIQALNTELVVISGEITS